MMIKVFSIFILMGASVAFGADPVTPKGMPTKNIHVINFDGRSATDFVRQMRNRGVTETTLSENPKVSRLSLFNDTVVCYESSQSTFCEIPNSKPDDVFGKWPFGEGNYWTGSQLKFTGTSAMNVFRALRKATPEAPNSLPEMACTKWCKGFLGTTPPSCEPDDDPTYECLFYVVSYKDAESR